MNEESLSNLQPEEVAAKFENCRFIGYDKKGKEGYEVCIQVNGERPSRTVRDRNKIAETIATVKALADLQLKRQDIDVSGKGVVAKQRYNTTHILTKKGKKVWTLYEAITALKDDYQKNTKSKSGMYSAMSACRITLKELAGVLPNGKDTLLTEIADDDVIEDYKEWAKDTLGVLKQTIDRRLSIINKMFKFAKKKRHFDGKYKCEKYNVKYGNVIYLKDHEVKDIRKWFNEFEKFDHLDCFNALLDLGCRQDDLWRITEGDVDLERPDPKVYIHASKGGQNRNLTITKQLLPIIKRRFTKSTNPKLKMFPYSNGWLSYGWKMVREKMGHAEDKAWTPHIIRHTCGSRLAQAHMSPQYIKEYLGHTSISSTFKYMHLASENTDACVDVLNQLNGDTTSVTHINKSTGEVEQLQLSEQQLKQVAKFIAELTTKSEGEKSNRPDNEVVHTD